MYYLTETNNEFQITTYKASGYSEEITPEEIRQLPEEKPIRFSPVSLETEIFTI